APITSGPHSTPDHPTGAERPVVQSNEATRVHGFDGRQRIGADAHRERSRGDAPPPREHREASGGPRRASLLPRLQARRPSVPTRRRHEVPGPEPLTAPAAGRPPSPAGRHY